MASRFKCNFHIPNILKKISYIFSLVLKLKMKRKEVKKVTVTNSETRQNLTRCNFFLQHRFRMWWRWGLVLLII